MRFIDASPGRSGVGVHAWLDNESSSIHDATLDLKLRIASLMAEFVKLRNGEANTEYVEVYAIGYSDKYHIADNEAFGNILIEVTEKPGQRPVKVDYKPAPEYRRFKVDKQELIFKVKPDQHIEWVN